MSAVWSWVLPFLSTDLQVKVFVWTGKGSCKNMLEQGQCLSDCWAVLSLQSEWQSVIEITELQRAEGPHPGVKHCLSCGESFLAWRSLVGWVKRQELVVWKRGTLETMPLTTRYYVLGFGLVFLVFFVWMKLYILDCFVGGQVKCTSLQQQIDCPGPQSMLCPLTLPEGEAPKLTLSAKLVMGIASGMT